jgi:Conjugative transposon protein TcpC
VASGVRSKPARQDRTVGAAIRSGGRLALWAAVGLLLVRGASAELAEPSGGGDGARRGGPAGDPATSAFAVRFARLFFEAPSSAELSSLYVPGSAPAQVAPGAEGTAVVQAEVAGIHDLGGGQETITVACQVEDGSALFLAVPIVRASAGEVAATGAPALVAGPAIIAEAPEDLRPLAGQDSAAIGDLLRRFLPAYFKAQSGADLTYLLASGAEVAPPGGGFELQGVDGLKQLGEGEGGRRTVVAEVAVRDTESEATYQLAYRIEVVRAGRWYVQRVEGALS